MDYIDKGISNMSIEKQKLEKLNGMSEDILKNLPGIDIASCLKRLGEDREFLKSLLKDFYNHYSNYADEVAECLARKDFTKAKELLHTIKGVAGNLSAYELFSASAKLENALIHNCSSDCQILFDKFKEALNHVLKSAVLINSDSSAPGISSEEQIQKITPLIHELADCLIRNNIRAEEVFHKLHRRFTTTECDKEIDKLEELLEMYDFKAALSCLKNIAHSRGITLE
jgi:two-component system sensor histidine kinase/response regulator